MSHEKKMDKAFDHFYKKKYKEAVKAFDGLLASGDLPDHIKPKIQQFKSMA
jgi:cytochrome c-type biogenesis protein CcmH/NrfG